MGLIYLVRHGQASFGADDYDVLSPLGHEQARVTGAALAARGIQPDRVVSGSLRRQQASLAALADAAGWSPDTVIDSDWNEFDHRAVVASHLRGGKISVTESVTPREYQQTFVRAVDAWTAGELIDVEPFSVFADRCRQALLRVADDDGTTVVVTSGGVIGVLAARSLAGDVTRWSQLNGVVINAAVSKLLVSPRGCTMLSFNEQGHLEHDRRLVTYR
ncbi:broad specificity phosphatase PhoE [Rudaeicoccus suwonensis]|uniref:Broad specificity phosphatase PhoE n=1 Tax=Rudaeicoccus suwonensis TaxID=657409 RepID=A0A561ECE8_9MICO|nr:broad specificity phosphatase PhoE [Rudaeicoccus suwonensis]